jgi:hypothetical protein
MHGGVQCICPPYMVAGPNGLVLKKIQNEIKFVFCFKFGLKIKKITDDARADLSFEW